MQHPMETGDTVISRSWLVVCVAPYASAPVGAQTPVGRAGDQDWISTSAPPGDA